MTEETHIKVSCLVFPSGESIIVESSRGQEVISTIIAFWQKQNPAYNDGHSSMGVVELNMPIAQFNKISKGEHK